MQYISDSIWFRFGLFGLQYTVQRTRYRVCRQYTIYIYIYIYV